MNNIDALKNTYSKYDSLELYNLYLTIDGYTDDAKTALNLIIEERGGVEQIKLAAENIINKNKEKNNIKYKVELYDLKTTSVEYVFNQLQSDILNNEELLEIVIAVKKNQDEKELDEKVTTKTIIGSLIGMLIGGVLGGIYLCLIFIYSSEIRFFLFVPIPFISYGFIWIFTKQSRENAVVAGFTAASIVLAIVIAFIVLNGF